MSSRSLSMVCLFPVPSDVHHSCPSDIIFPTLPSWFTAPLRVRNRRSDSIHHPNGRHQREATPPPSTADSTSLPHDHVLLESLYYGVFENRFINLRPTGGYPHFSTLTGGLIRYKLSFPFTLPPIFDMSSLHPSCIYVCLPYRPYQHFHNPYQPVHY